MEKVLLDLRYAVRSMLRRPSLAVGAVLTLALGIGANTAIFSVVDSVLLRAPAGLMAPERLVALYTSDFSGPPFGGSSYPDYFDLSAHNDVFAGIASYSPDVVAVGESDVTPAPALAVSANYFDVLGVRPAAGRSFMPDEEENAGDVTVLGNALAVRHFGSPEGALRQFVRVSGRALEVIGVAPAGFTGFERSSAAELFVPTRTAFRLGMGLPGIDDRGSRGISIVARLAPGVTLEQARTAMRLAAARQHAAYTDDWTDVRGEPRRISVLTENEARVPPDSRSAIVGLAGVLMATVGLVLLICCANVAGLLIARTAGRAREIGLRVSLGATGRRIISQLLVESMVLAVTGGMLGILLAFWLTDVITRSIGQGNSLGFGFGAAVDMRVLAFTAAITIVTGLLFGLAPALRARRTDVMSVLKRDRDGLGGSARTPLRSVLVSAQIALSLPLLVGAILLGRTLSNAYRIDPGFALDRMLLVNAAPLPGANPSSDMATTIAVVRDRIAALPGVRTVSWGSSTPLTGGGSRRGMQVLGYTPQPGEDMEFHINHVGPGFFATTGIAIERGRAITEADRIGAADVVVVNETFASRFWPGQDPIGQRIAMGRTDTLPRLWTVVGVARDVNFISLTAPVLPYVWIPALQMARPPLFHIGSQGDPRVLITPIQEILREVAPGWAVNSASTMEDRVSSALFAERAAGASIALFAMIALLLAAVGLGGVIAYAVTQRTREVGIRVALGAVPRGVLALFLRQALPVVAIGAGIGLILAFITARTLSGLLIGVGATDLVTFVAAAGLLCATALLATWLPARRAVRVDPMIALRSE